MSFREELEEAFRLFDREGDGQIEAQVHAACSHFSGMRINLVGVEQPALVTWTPAQQGGSGGSPGRDGCGQVHKFHCLYSL